MHHHGFDECAASYDEALNSGLSATGEDKHYFARGRIAWLAQCLRQIGVQPTTVLDFGCGIGASLPHLFDLLKVERVIAIESSEVSLELARRDYCATSTEFLLTDEFHPNEQIDLAYCNGVFHHIPPAERCAAIDFLYRSLNPRGLFALWENNPWNPGTRYVMRRIPFDRDAEALTSLEARQLLQAGGFEVIRTDFLFIFPRALRWFRGIEAYVSRLPLGGQYQILCRKVCARVGEYSK